MEQYKGPFLLICILILLAPFGIYVKKFTSIETTSNLRVSFNPMECYACPGCPCEYEINNNTYRLSKNDKSLCKVPYYYISQGIEKKSKQFSVTLSQDEYETLQSCLEWYSKHPSI